jgi:hypothetical protein
MLAFITVESIAVAPIVLELIVVHAWPVEWR